MQQHFTCQKPRFIEPAVIAKPCRSGTAFLLPPVDFPLLTPGNTLADGSYVVFERKHAFLDAGRRRVAHELRTDRGAFPIPVIVRSWNSPLRAEFRASAVKVLSGNYLYVLAGGVCTGIDFGHDLRTPPLCRGFISAGIRKGGFA